MYFKFDMTLFDERVGLAQGNPPAWLVRPVGLIHHPNAVDDRTHTHAEGAPRTVRGHMREVCLGVKSDGLVARVVADHVALSTVDAHVLVDQRHYLLSVVQLVVGSDVWQSLSYHVLCACDGGRKEEEGRRTECASE